MKFKKLLSAALAFTFLFAVGCDKTNQNSENSSEEASQQSAFSSEEVSSTVSKAPAPQLSVNPLTGLENISPEKANQRPVAVMINNISTAQSVQCGVNQADIVYETEVEKGITRLMAVFQDITAVPQLGTVRSARYDYIDLAMGHNAIYCHHGQDPTYAKPHLKDTFTFVIDENNAGKRLRNGKSREHTLYVYGPKLWDFLKKEGNVINKRTNKNWLDFAPASEQIMLSENKADKVYVPFSGSQKTSFSYNAATQKYTRISNGVTLKDYRSGKTAEFKNIFIALTRITDMEDGYHRNIYLSKGDGFYVSNGTYIPVKWSKGAASSPIKFTNTDGSPLKVNAGNSWICIADKNRSNPSFS